MAIPKPTLLMKSTRVLRRLSRIESWSEKNDQTDAAAGISNQSSGTERRLRWHNPTTRPITAPNPIVAALATQSRRRGFSCTGSTRSKTA